MDIIQGLTRNNSYSVKHGTDDKDRFFQGGVNNINIAIDTGGKESEFRMFGKKCQNIAQGGSGDDIFTTGGFDCVNEIFGGKGKDTVILSGYLQDYNVADIADPNDSTKTCKEFTNKYTNTKTIIHNDVEEIKFNESFPMMQGTQQLPPGRKFTATT